VGWVNNFGFSFAFNFAAFFFHTDLKGHYMEAQLTQGD